MALISCRECGKQISDQAAACPSCGAPIRATADAPGIVTTQQTGKRFKGLQLVGALFMGGGTVACASQSYGATAALFLIGLVIYFGARVGAWWSHG